jgi:hypothetical protein
MSRRGLLGLLAAYPLGSEWAFGRPIRLVGAIFLSSDDPAAWLMSTGVSVTAPHAARRRKRRTENVFLKSSRLPNEWRPQPSAPPEWERA